MGRYLVKRLIWLFITVFSIATIVFFLSRLIPGDPVRIMLGEHASPDLVAHYRSLYNLDESPIAQYTAWWNQVFRGNMGVSLVNQRPVLELLIRSITPTLVLTFGGIFVAVVIGLSLGITAAANHGTWKDSVSSGIAFIGISIPEFFLSLILILVFSCYLGWFPSGGYSWAGGRKRPFVSYLVLPTFTVGLSLSSALARMVRSALLEVLNKNYVLTAQAKGVPEILVVLRHALRNALLPVITVVGLQLGYLVGGVVIVETVFSIPGVGRLLINAVYQRDYPLIQGCIIFISSMFCLINLLTDFAYAWLNPKISYE